MKLLIYSEYFLPIRGGTQTVVLELARGIHQWSATKSEEEKIAVTVVTQTDGPPGEDSILPFRVVRRPRFRELVALLRDADLLHIAGPALLPLFMGCLVSKPVIVEHHGFQVACPNGQMYYEPARRPCPGYYMSSHYFQCVKCNKKTVGIGQSIKRLVLTPIRRHLCNTADTNITPTNWLATILKLSRMATIYHGVSPPLAVTSGSRSSCIFAYQGRLVTTKGVEVLIQAARELHKENRSFFVKIIGVGPEQKQLQAQASDLRGQIEFLGEVAGDQLEDILSDVAAVVMPSLGGEVFGLVALENMVRGKLMIVSDIGALREVVGDSALVFPPGDAIALASCMRRVLDDPHFTSSQGAAANSRSMHAFNRENMIEAHISVYLKALARTGSTASSSSVD